MFTSSAMLQLRSSTEDGTMVGNERRSSVGSSWNPTPAPEVESANSGPVYPSVAQRIAVWRNLTTETSCDQAGHGLPLDQNANTGRTATPISATNGTWSDRIGEGIDKSFVDHLVAELTTSRKRNKKLSIQLAKMECEKQQIQLSQRLYNDQVEATIASRVADTLSALFNDRMPMLPGGIDNGSVFANEIDLKNGKTDNAALMADDCRSVLTFIRDHGCQLPISETNQDDTGPPINGPFARDVGTDARQCDDKEHTEEGFRERESALLNANKELNDENVKLKDALEVAEASLRRAKEESSQLRVQLENLRNHGMAALKNENALLSSDVEKFQRRYEQAEAKWEREAYELRNKFQALDEEKFRLTEELQTLQRELAHRPIDNSANDERVKTYVEENKHLMAEVEKHKRLVTVLRRKLSAVNAGGASSSK